MIGDVTAADEIWVVCGYTDYPRRIIIREVFLEILIISTFSLILLR